VPSPEIPGALRPFGSRVGQSINIRQLAATRQRASEAVEAGTETSLEPNPENQSEINVRSSRRENVARYSIRALRLRRVWMDSAREARQRAWRYDNSAAEATMHGGVGD
jgi:hypothetical protein